MLLILYFSLCFHTVNCKNLENLMKNGTVVEKTHIGIGFEFEPSTLIIHNEREEEEDNCTMTLIHPIKIEPPYHMCLEKWGLISSTIRKRGRWEDCDALRPMWIESLSYGDGVFMDIGANIGSCSLFMLNFNVEVISFEPIPSNYKKIIRSVQANHGFNTRIKLFPYGLGANTSVVEAFGEPGNLGNTVIGKPVLDYDNRQNMQWMKDNPYKDIQIRKLDDIIWANRLQNAPPPLINLLKIDCQGYELKVLAGAEELLKARAIKTMKIELARKHLEAQGSSGEAYCRKLHQHGFTLFHVHKRNTNESLSLKQCISVSHNHGVIDLVAKLL